MSLVNQTQGVTFKVLGIALLALLMLIPLAEVTRFRLQKNEMLIRIDDAPKESRFHIKAMLLRPEWDRAQQRDDAASSTMNPQRLDPAMMGDQR